MDNKHLYPYQQKMLEACLDCDRVIVNKSRQVGISYTAACLGLIGCLIDRETCLIVSPSLRQSNHVMDYVYHFLMLLRDWWTIQTVDESKTLLSFDDGGEIYSLPCQPNTVRGIRAHRVFLDESAHFLHGLDKMIMTAIQPSLSRGGNLTMISTPFGVDNVFYYIWSQEDVYKNYKRLAVNFNECKDLDFTEILRIKAIDPMTFNQEYNNQFLSDVDEAEFPLHLITKCIDMELDYEMLQRDKIYRIGVDIGRRRDLTAIAIWENINNRYILRRAETYFNMKYVEQEGRLREILDNYTVSKMRIDATGIGDMLSEKLRDDYGNIVYPLHIDHESKQEIVLCFKEQMHNNGVILVNDPKVISNIRAIQRSYTHAGYLKFDSRRDSEIGHADLFWALALGLYEERKKGTGMFYLE